MKKIINYIKNNGKFIIIYLVLAIALICPLPYYIDAPGGLIDVSKRMKIDGAYESTGTFNLAYVTEYKANLPLLLFSFINPNWKVYSKEEVVYDDESYKDALVREQLMLQEAYASATIVGYQKANKDVNIISNDLYVAYILEDSDTNLDIGDKIIQINDKEIDSMNTLTDIVNQYDIDDKLHIKVINNDKEYDRYAIVQEIDDKKAIGISLQLVPQVEVEPDITFYLDKKESGPSGGLMMALSIYNSLIKEDLTGGDTIVGTGTIDVDGNVGPIGGVEYKLKGAVKKKADVFLVPSGDNYEEANKLKQKYGYDIDIVAIRNFDEAVNYLENRF